MRAALNKFAGAVMAAVSKLDGQDAMLFVGLAMLGGGIGVYNAAAGLAVTGSILVAVAIFGTR